jgi:hypothetical protein
MAAAMLEAQGKLSCLLDDIAPRFTGHLVGLFIRPNFSVTNSLSNV